MIIHYNYTDYDFTTGEITFIEQCNFPSKTVFYSWDMKENCGGDYTVAIFKIKCK